MYLSADDDREDDDLVPGLQPRRGPQLPVVHQHPDHLPVEGVEVVLAQALHELPEGRGLLDVCDGEAGVHMIMEPCLECYYFR